VLPCHPVQMQCVTDGPVGKPCPAYGPWATDRTPCCFLHYPGCACYLLRPRIQARPVWGSARQERRLSSFPPVLCLGLPPTGSRYLQQAQ